MRLAALLLALVLASSGCSLVLVKRGPEEPEPRSWPSCTEHRFWPVADLVAAVAALTGAAYFAQSDDDFKEVGIAVEGGLAAGFALSSVRGFRHTSRCVQARAAYERAADQGR